MKPDLLVELTKLGYSFAGYGSRVTKGLLHIEPFVTLARSFDHEVYASLFGTADILS